LLAAALGSADTTTAPNDTIQRLIESKLLLFRPHSNDVSVWHGADIDLRGALEAVKERHRSSFRLLEFLGKELPAPTWRPVQFNDDFHIKRYFTGSYLTPTQFHSLCQSPASVSRAQGEADGLILFVLAESAADQERIRELAKTVSLGPTVVIAVPARQAAVAESGLEVACLEQMIRDPELIAKDPLVELELRNLLDDARGYLHRAIDQLVTPQLDGPTFWHQGHPRRPESAADLRRLLSDVIGNVYTRTPRINNELINRRKVSAPVANARKKLEMAILERAGMAGLGIQGNFPDASIFRTVLVNTGLYRAGDGERWRFATPAEVSDPGLRAIWEELQAFFQEPGEGGKEFRPLFQRLFESPIGLRAGVLPVLVAAAFRAFPAAISLKREGMYVEDILPTVVEDICRHPELYTLEVLSLSASQRKILDAVQGVFGDFDPGVTRQKDRVRNSFDCLRAWLNSLPPLALATNRLSPMAVDFRAALRSQGDPVQLLFSELPRVIATAVQDEPGILLREVKTELESALDRLREEAADSVRRTLDVGLDRRESSLAEACQKWAKCFSIQDLQRAGSVQAVSFINRIEQRYDTDGLLLDSLASQLVGQPTSRWDDGSLDRFDRALADAVRTVEDEAVRLAVTGGSTQLIRRNLSRLIEARLRGLYENLRSLTGAQQAKESLDRLTKANEEGVTDGNDSRSA
jgi:hypothetical protein